MSADGIRRTGIEAVGDAPWGTHFCQFYATKEDLVDVLVPYFKAGLEQDEHCVWVTSPPLEASEAWEALARRVPNLETHRREGRIEILPHTDWYLLGGRFDQDRVLKGWVARLEQALAQGFSGLRLSGNTFWLEKSEWRGFAEYEAAIDEVLGQFRMLALCTYSLERCGASEVADVIRNHEFALIKRDGTWDLIESYHRRRVQDAHALERAALLEEAEAARREAENDKQRLEAVMNALPVGIEITDARGVRVRHNEAFERIWGGLRAIGGPTSDAWWAETGEPISPEQWASARALATGQPMVGQVLKIQRLEGSRATVLNSAAPVRDADGRVVGSVVAIQDISQLRAAEEAARLSHRAFVATVESLDDGFVTLDRTWSVTYVNRRAAANVGMEPEAMVGRNLWQLFPALVGTPQEAAHRQVMATRAPLSIEVRGVLTDTWYRLGISPNSGGIAVIWTDISARKRAEVALSQSEGRFRALAEALPQVVWTADAEGGTEWLNRQWYEYTGGAPGAGEGWSWTKLVHPDDLPGTLEKWQAARARGTPYQNELRLRRHDGLYHFFLARAWPQPDADGGALRWVGTNTDIEELKGLERLYAVLSRVNEAIVRIQDETALFTEVCRIVSAEGLFPLAWIGLVEGQDVVPAAHFGPEAAYLEQIRVQIDGVLGAGPTGTCIRENRSVINGDFDSNAETAPWRGPALRHGFRASAAFPLRRGGRAAGALTLYATRPAVFDSAQVKLLESLTADLSYALDAMAQERLRAEAEQALREREKRLREVDDRKNEFLAVLSHELRNPLAPITNSLHVLERVPSGGAQAAHAKAVIGRQVEQLSRLVGDLLDVTRISSNKVRLQREQVELNQLVARAAEDQRTLFKQNGVTLEVHLAPAHLYTHADPARLSQVVGNLLQNAAKFTTPGGHTWLSLGLDATGDRAVMRVADDGVGMTQETLASLFEPFAQADQTLDRSKGGLGLGLALVKGLIDLHGGEVRAHSAGLGRGTELVVSLPLEAPKRVEVPTPAPARERPKRRVLVIEDNVDAANSLREVLELDGHEVAVAYNGPDGLAKARELKPEVVLCDIGLPGMDGFEVAQAFRGDEALKGACLVALSGYALPEDIKRASEAGFGHHLAKPPCLEKLAQVLTNLGRFQQGNRLDYGIEGERSR